MVKNDKQKQIASYVARLRDASLKSTWDPKYVAEHLKDGGFFHELIGIHIDPQYIKDVYKNISDKDLYGSKLYDGNPQKGEKGLKDYIKPEDKDAIQEAQDKHLDDIKQRQAEEPEDQKEKFEDDEQSKETAKKEKDKDKDKDENNIYDEEPESDIKDKDKEKKDFKSSGTKPDEWQKDTSIGEEAPTAGAGEAAGAASPTAAGAGASGAGTAAAGASTAAAGAGTAAAGAGTAAAGAATAAGTAATASGGATVAIGAATIGGPTAVVAVIIIVLIIFIAFIGPLFFLGKRSHEQANAANSSQFQTPLVYHNPEKIKEYLDKDTSEFIKKIEEIKTNATGEKKQEVEKLCDELISDVKELLAKTEDTPEAKGEKENFKIKIKEKVDQLFKIVNIRGNIPCLHQPGGGWCGQTSVMMVICTFNSLCGIKQNSTVADYNKLGSYSTSSSLVALLQRNLPNKVVVQKNLTIGSITDGYEPLYQQAIKKNPVVIGTRFPNSAGTSGSYMHYMVVTGYAGDANGVRQYHVNNPFSGGCSQIVLSETYFKNNPYPGPDYWYMYVEDK